MPDGLKGVSSRFPYLLILPAVVTLCFVSIFPLAYILYLSVHSLNLGSGELAYVGLANYFAAFKDSRLSDSLVTTLTVMLIALTSEFCLGLVIALLLNRRGRFRGLYRTLFMLPFMTTSVVTAVMWKYMLNAAYGTVNWMIRLAYQSWSGNWLGSSLMAVPAIALTDIWGWTPFVVLVMLAGLQSVPEDLIEAARVDGASGLLTLRYVTLPLMKPLLLLVLLLRGMDLFRLYDLIFGMSWGGPGTSTETISFYLYKVGYVFLDLGYMSALAFMLSVGIMIVSLILIRSFYKVVWV